MRLVIIFVFFYALAAHAAPPTAETEVRAGALHGTMLATEGFGAVVLIIPGSGPTNRDGNNPLGINGAPYKKLGEALALRGISTVRVDKRGMFGSSGAAVDANRVTVADYADDVHDWIKVIRQKTGAACVWVAGHSEGGLVALVASGKPDGFCGLILLAAPGRPAGAILRDQLRLAVGSGPLLQQATSAIDALERGRHPDVYAMHPALQQMFAPPVQGFLISMFSYDPAQLIADFHKPALILQGERDLQVSVVDAKRLKEAAPSARLVLLPDSNHVFKTVTSADAAVNKAAYMNPNVPLTPALADAISDFISVAESTH